MSSRQENSKGLRALRTSRNEKQKSAKRKIEWNILQICPKCNQFFALLFSKNFVCNTCTLQVCKDCVYIFHNRQLCLCYPCYKDLIFTAKSGQWHWGRFTFREDKGEAEPADPLEFLFQKFIGFGADFSHNGDRSENASLGQELSHNGQVASNANLSDSSLLLGMDEESKLEMERDSLSVLSDGAQERNTTPSGGEIELTIDYDFRLCIFRVIVRRCRNLNPGGRQRHTCNPFVKIYLLPDKTRNGRRKTKVRRQTDSPEFHEQLKYNIDKSDLETRSLLVTVWHKGDVFGGNAFLGEVTVPLEFCDFKSAEPRWYQLKEQAPNFISRGNIVYRGDLDLAVKYVTAGKVNITDLNKLNSKGELQVWLKGARNLSCCNPKHVCNPLAKMYFLPDYSPQTKRKTPVGKRTNNPTWNVILKYEDMPFAGLEERGLEIAVYDHERFGANSFLGGVRLNLGPGDPTRADIDWMDATGPECRMWVALLDRPDTWIDGTLPLRPQMD